MEDLRYSLPVRPETGGKKTNGYFTPKADKQPQVMAVPPKRVLPIVFIPGIMGSNLRMSAERQRRLCRTNNVAWRPDSISESLALKDKSAGERQAQLDPGTTEVDSYTPGQDNTGSPSETAIGRNIAVHAPPMDLAGEFDGRNLLLVDDPVGTRNGKSSRQKALERGWGEIYFGSYKDLLITCEVHLNSPFSFDGEPSRWWRSQVLDTAPSTWGAIDATPLEKLDSASFKNAMRDCWFPVHAMGYNWLESNGVSGNRIAGRVRQLIASYKQKGFVCNKVILITHSMGGLVARAAMHPKLGGIQDLVAGVVHGVMPAIGAGTAYKRIRCGFEGNSASITRKVLGYSGKEVTAVLGNAQGGMELLPTSAYGNGWLQARFQNNTRLSLPAHGDPYEEIYKAKSEWFRLFEPSWINQAGLDDRNIERSYSLLDGAREFHKKINDYYHPMSFALYGADKKRTAWNNVVWDLGLDIERRRSSEMTLMDDNAEGKLILCDLVSAPNYVIANDSSVVAMLRGPVDPGDQTVPAHSADHQYRSGLFKGIFRQVGYEHQTSYSDSAVLAGTCYSLIRIIQKVDWETK